MRVVLITDPFLPKIDGIVTMVTKTIEFLKKRGDEVLVFAPDGGPEELFGAKVIGIPSGPFWLYPELRLALPRSRMRQMIQDFKPDVLHVFEPALLGFAGIYYGQVLKIPLVISCHTNIPAYLRYYNLRLLEPTTWWLLRLRHCTANLNLCTSSVTLQELSEHGINDLALWQRAVDSSQFEPGERSVEMRERLSGGEPDKPLLLYVGRLSAEKDIHTLRDVLTAMPEVRLGIVGDGPERQSLEKHFAGTPTVFMGYLRGKELASTYASADLFLMPSKTETLGLVLMEAMAAGCPVVACRAGGVPDAVQDGVTGFLFEPDAPNGLVNAVKRAFASGAELECIRKNAAEDVAAHSWEAATDQLVALYQQTIDGYEVKIRTETPVGRVVKRSLRAFFRKMLP